MPQTSRTDAERVIAGRYRLQRSIARGGMAEVWEAADQTLGRQVAVKTLLPHLAADTSFQERFRREAISAARLAHPNVVETYDAGVDGGTAYIVMELVAAHTLREVITSAGELVPSRAVRIAAQVAAALDHAHQQGIVHRDVKPANILVGDDDRVKVADFGIAKVTDLGPLASDDLTVHGSVMGTAKYLSPEQLNGEAVDGRADVYALGVVLYEMLCGRPPFLGDTDVALAVQHLTAAPLGPRQVRAGVPRPLEAAVLRALAKSPSERFATAGDFQSALLSIDLGPDDALPLVVRDATPPGGVAAVPFRQTERTWIWLTALIVVVAVTLGVVGLLFATTETGQRLFNGNGSAGMPSAPGSPLPVRQVLLFDPPPGDGSEHDDELPRLSDGDPSTTWSSHQYVGRAFGGLKPGVGVVMTLERAQRLKELTITSATRGWALEVYLADGPQATLDRWGTPVASRRDVSEPAVTLPLPDRTAGAVLVWVTDPGPANQVVIGEIEVG